MAKATAGADRGGMVMRLKRVVGRNSQVTREGDILRVVRDGLAAVGMTFYRLNSGAFKIGTGSAGRYFRATFPGCPDGFTLLADGRTLWIECKAPKGVLTTEQAGFRDQCEARGVPWVLVRQWKDLVPWLYGEGV